MLRSASNARSWEEVDMVSSSWEWWVAPSCGPLSGTESKEESVQNISILLSLLLDYGRSVTSQVTFLLSCLSIHQFKCLLQARVVRTSDLEAFSKEIMILDNVTVRLRLTSGVLDKCRMFDYCLLYYLGANFPIKKQTQQFIYSSTIYVLNFDIIK